MAGVIFFDLPDYGLGVALVVPQTEITPLHEFIGVTPRDPAYEVYLAPDLFYECCEHIIPPTTETETGIPPIECELPFM